MFVGIPEGFDGLPQGFSGAIHGGTGILEHLDQRLDSVDGGRAIGHITVGIEAGVVCNDGGTVVMGSLGGGDDHGEGIQRSLHSGGIEPFLRGLVDQGLDLANEGLSLCQPVTLALIGGLSAGPGVRSGCRDRQPKR